MKPFILTVIAVIALSCEKTPVPPMTCDMCTPAAMLFCIKDSVSGMPVKPDTVKVIKAPDTFRLSKNQVTAHEIDRLRDSVIAVGGHAGLYRIEIVDSTYGIINIDNVSVSILPNSSLCGDSVSYTLRMTVLINANRYNIINLHNDVTCF